MNKGHSTFNFILINTLLCHGCCLAKEQVIYLDNGFINWQSPVGAIDRLLLVADNLKLNPVTSIKLSDQVGVLAIAIDHLDADCDSLVDISGPPPKKFLFQVNTFSGCEASAITIRLPTGRQGKGAYAKQNMVLGMPKAGPCESLLSSFVIARSAEPGEPGIFSRMCGADVNFDSKVVKIINPGGLPGDRGLTAVKSWISSLSGQDEYYKIRISLPGDANIERESSLSYLVPLKDAIESEACKNYYNSTKFAPMDGEKVFQSYSDCFTQDPDDYYWMASSWYLKLLSQASFDTVQAIAAGEHELAFKISQRAAALRSTVPLTAADQLTATKIISDAVAIRSTQGLPVAKQLPSRRISPLDSRPVVVLDARSLESFVLPTAILPSQIDNNGRLAALVLNSNQIELSLDALLENFPIEVEQAELNSNTKPKSAAADSRWTLESVTNPDAKIDFSQFGGRGISMKATVNQAKVAKVLASLVSDNGMPFQLNWSYSDGDVTKKFNSLAYLSFQSTANPPVKVVGDEIHNDAHYAVYISNGLSVSHKIVPLGCTLQTGEVKSISMCAPNAGQSISNIPPTEIMATRTSPEVLGQYIIAPITDGQLVDYQVACQLTSFNAFFNAQLTKSNLTIEVKDKNGLLGNFSVSRDTCDQLRSHKFSVLLVDPNSDAKLVVSGEFLYSDGSRRVFGPQESFATSISISDSDLK
jgi:hypothetical protein